MSGDSSNPGYNCRIRVRISDQISYTRSVMNRPPMTARTPRLTSGSAMVASSLATTMSQFSSISVPPPYAPPLTAAIIGLDEKDRLEIDPKPLTAALMSSSSLSGVFAECARWFHLDWTFCQHYTKSHNGGRSRNEICASTKRATYSGDNDNPVRVFSSKKPSISNGSTSNRP